MVSKKNKKYYYSIKYRFILGLALVLTLAAMVVHVLSLLSGGDLSLPLIVVIFFVFTYWGNSRNAIAEVTKDHLVLSPKRKIAWKDVKKVVISRSLITTAIRVFYNDGLKKSEKEKEAAERNRYVVFLMVDRVDQLIVDIYKKVPKAAIDNRINTAGRR